MARSKLGRRCAPSPSSSRLAMIKQDGVAADFPLRGSHQIGSSRLSAYCSVCCQAPGLSSTSAVSHREAELNLSHLSTHNGIISVIWNWLTWPSCTMTYPCSPSSCFGSCLVNGEGEWRIGGQCCWRHKVIAGRSLVLSSYWYLLLSLPVSLQYVTAQCNCYQYHT